MRAIVVDRWTEPRDLGVREVPEPELGPGTLAVEVRAAGCNFFDILMVRGQYQVKPPFPFIPGAELAGVVRAVGSGVAGFAEKLAVARRAGADVAIDYRSADWVEQVRAATDGRGADVIYDPVGGDVFDGSLKCIAWNGRLLVIGFASGRIPEVKLNRVLLKNISLVGPHWGAHAPHQPERIAATLAALLALYREGKVEPVVYRTYLLEELPAALEALGSRQSYGKVVVAP